MLSFSVFLPKASTQNFGTGPPLSYRILTLAPMPSVLPCIRQMFDKPANGKRRFSLRMFVCWIVTDNTAASANRAGFSRQNLFKFTARRTPGLCTHTERATDRHITDPSQLRASPSKRQQLSLSPLALGRLAARLSASPNLHRPAQRSPAVLTLRLQSASYIGPTCAPPSSRSPP